jgi:hypothetical protein
MANGFSGAVKIGDLSDFIAPSQSCVVTLEGNKILDASSDLEVRRCGRRALPAAAAAAAVAAGAALKANRR